MSSENPRSAAATYKGLLTDRQNALDEAYDSACLTIPYLFPSTDDILQVANNTEDRLPKPWQSLGARGVNTLAAKLLLTLLPPSSSFMRYKINPAVLADVEDPEELAAVKTQLLEKLAERENEVLDETEGAGHRVKWNLVLKYLIVGGNACLYMQPKKGSRIYSLNSYVCRRDTTGNLLELVTVDVLDRASLTPDQQALMEVEDFTKDDSKEASNSAMLYSHIRRIHSDKFEAYQELNGQRVPGSDESYSEADLPWLALRFTAIDGQAYGRGFVEDYRGDILAYDEISKSLVFAALNAAKLIFLVKPGSATKIAVLESADNGAYVAGDPDDIATMTLEKGADLNVALERHRDLERSISADFLLNRSFQRDAERVTAEEIRRMAQELEDTLGGTYSLLAQDGLLPFATHIDRQLVSRGELLPLPNKAVRPTIVTGLSALGRGHEFQRLRESLGTLTELLPIKPEIGRRLRDDELLRRVLLLTGTDANGLIIPEAEIQAQMQAEQEQASAQALSEKAIGGAAAPVAAGVVEAVQADAQGSGQQGVPIQ